MKVRPIGAVLATAGSHQCAEPTRELGLRQRGLANVTVQLRFFSDASRATVIPGGGGSQGVNLRVFFDQIVLSLNSTTPVELSRFEVE
jgi:hypothetical protein